MSIVVVICRQRHGGVSQQGMLLFEIALTGFLEEGRVSGEILRHTHSHLHIEKTKFCRIYQDEYTIFIYGRILPSRQTIP